MLVSLYKELFRVLSHQKAGGKRALSDVKSIPRLLTKHKKPSDNCDLNRQ
jgi:hypothetical protein